MESGQGITSGAVMAAVDFEAAARALETGVLPCSDLLTELAKRAVRFAGRDACNGSSVAAHE